MVFDKQYFDCYCNGQPYKDTLDVHLMQYWKFCLSYAIAMKVSTSQAKHWLDTKSVLDAGCGMGHVVKDLCDHEVPAWGYDNSEYAIKNKISDRVWLASHDDQLPRYPDNIFDIIFSNSFQYCFNIDKILSWICQSYRVCAHSVLFMSVIQDDLQESITENLEDIQIIKSREWWNQQFLTAGFKSFFWVGPMACVYFK